MPVIEFQGQEMSCEVGERLRDVLFRSKLSPHKGKAQFLNCRGFGTCGTCAVEVEGSLSEKTAREKWRLGFPPHQADSGLRLACQARVLGNLRVTKHEGFWGEKVLVKKKGE